LGILLEMSLIMTSSPLIGESAAFDYGALEGSGISQEAPRPVEARPIFRGGARGRLMGVGGSSRISAPRRERQPAGVSRVTFARDNRLI